MSPVLTPDRPCACVNYADDSPASEVPEPSTEGIDGDPGDRQPTTFVIALANGEELSEPGKSLAAVLDELKAEFHAAVADGSSADGFSDLVIWSERRQAVAAVLYHDIDGARVQRIVRLRASGPDDEQPAEVELNVADPDIVTGPFWTLVWLDAGAVEHPLKTSTHSLDAILDAMQAGFSADQFLGLDSSFCDCVVFDENDRIAATVSYPRTRNGELRIVRFDT